MMDFRSFITDEGGTASIEFCFVIPIIMTIFMASFEASMFMVRHAMLERSIDIVVRDIRLGNYSSLNHTQLKTEICSGGMMATDVATCVKSMRIWMQPISTVDFDMSGVPAKSCQDKRADIAPLPEPTGAEFGYGSDNDIMLMRICLKEEPMFPTTLVGAGMIKDELDGNYAIMTTTVFVNEPG